MLGLGLLMAAVGMIAGSRKDSRAWLNRRNYWAMSPAERERERRRAEAQVDREERLTRERSWSLRKVWINRKEERAIKNLRRYYAEHGNPPLRSRLNTAPFESEVLKARYAPIVRPEKLRKTEL